MQNRCRYWTGGTLGALALLLSLPGCADGVSYDVAPTKAAQFQEVPFDSLFLRDEIIELSHDVVIGQVSYLDVDSRGRFLVTDLIGNAVYVFDNSGHLIKHLEAESCHPGFAWRPIRAYFERDDSIVLLNSGPWGYRFDSAGDCLGEFDPSFTPPRALEAGKSGRLIGLYGSPSSYEFRVLDSLGVEVGRFGSGDYMKNIVYRMEGGGIIQDRSGDFIVALTPLPYLFRFSEGGNFIETIGGLPPFFRPAPEDLPDRQGARRGLASAVVALADVSSTTLSILDAEPGLVMVQYLNSYNTPSRPEEAIGIALIRLDADEGISFAFSDRAFNHARDGRAYQIADPLIDVGGEIGNARVVVYRLRLRR